MKVTLQQLETNSFILSKLYRDEASDINLIDDFTDLHNDWNMIMRCIDRLYELGASVSYINQSWTIKYENTTFSMLEESKLFITNIEQIYSLIFQTCHKL